MRSLWDDSLLLGFDEIDNQHKSIFAQFEKLSNAVQEGSPESILEELAVFLFDYTHVHFATEDRIMVEYSYPKIEEQRQEHGEFSRVVNDLKSKIEKDGILREMAIDMSGKLFRWVIQHIRNHDKEMVEFVKEQMSATRKAEIPQ